MSKKIFSNPAILLLLLGSTACSTYSDFYQLSRVEATTEHKTAKDGITIENEECSIRLNLWEDNGTMELAFGNKTSENIQVDLSKCFFVRNGYAMNFDAYKNIRRTRNTNLVSPDNYTQTSEEEAKKMDENTIFKKASSKRDNLKGYDEKAFVQQYAISDYRTNINIPAKTRRILKETDCEIENMLYRDCDLFLYPSKKEEKNKSLTFNSDNSPLKFGCIITYRIGDAEKTIRADFFVKEIKNFEEKDFVKTVKELKSVCRDEKPSSRGKGDQNAYDRHKIFTEEEASAFYKKYKKLPSDLFLH